MRKNPGFTTVAVLTLALGVGANTAIFAVADRLLVRPQPVDRRRNGFGALVGMRQCGKQQSFDDFNYPLFHQIFQRGNSVFNQLTATASTIAVGLGARRSDRTPRRALLVSGIISKCGGVDDAALGHAFAQNEGVEIDDAPVVVLSHGLWRRRFGGDPRVIGR